MIRSDQTVGVAGKNVRNISWHTCEQLKIFIHSKWRYKTRTGYICSNHRGSTSARPEVKCVRDGRQSHSCYGNISFVYGSRKLVTIRHDNHHTKRESCRGIPDTSKKRVSELTRQGIPPFKVFNIVRSAEVSSLIKNAVTPVWLQCILKDFKRDEDSFISCRKYLDDIEELSLLFFKKYHPVLIWWPIWERR